MNISSKKKKESLKGLHENLSGIKSYLLIYKLCVSTNKMYKIKEKNVKYGSLKNNQLKVYNTNKQQSFVIINILDNLFSRHLTFS